MGGPPPFAGRVVTRQWRDNAAKLLGESLAATFTLPDNTTFTSILLTLLCAHCDSTLNCAAVGLLPAVVNCTGDYTNVSSGGVASSSTDGAWERG